MNKVLMTRREEIAAGMRGLCDAVGKLGSVREALEKHVATLPPGHRDEQTLLKLTRSCNNLVDSVAHMPDEMFAIMLDVNHVGGAELIKRMQAASSSPRPVAVPCPLVAAQVPA